MNMWVCKKPCLSYVFKQHPEITRIWCDYEVYSAVMNPNMELDLVISLNMHGRQEAKIITRNLVPGESAVAKLAREQDFPIFLLDRGLQVCLEKGQEFGQFRGDGFVCFCWNSWYFAMQLMVLDLQILWLRVQKWSAPTLQWFSSAKSVVKCQGCVEVALSRQLDHGAWQDQHLPSHCPEQRAGVSERERTIATEFSSCESDFAFDSGNPGMAPSHEQEFVAEECQRFTCGQVERLWCFIERHFPRILGSQFGTLRRVVRRFCSESTGGVFATVLGEFEAELRRLCSAHRCISPSIGRTNWPDEAAKTTSRLHWLQEPEWCRRDSGSEVLEVGQSISTVSPVEGCQPQRCYELCEFCDLNVFAVYAYVI